MPRLTRPLPPTDLTDVAYAEEDERFVPAPDVLGWITRAFLDDGAPLHNPEHEHLVHATIGVLWTNAKNVRQQRAVVGTAESPNFRGNRWIVARQECQLRQWFGVLPDFVVTLSAPYAAAIDDATFCALVEHELYHCAQELDQFGAPKFRKDGRPVFGIRGHDVEQFVGVARRYGAAAAGVELLVAAAKAKPLVPASAIEGACGTCHANVA